MTKPTGVGRGGRRPGAGRPRGPDVLAALAGIRRELAAQNACLERLQRDRRGALEQTPLILRRLTALERLMRGGDLHTPPRSTRRRPLGQ
jgi:hypothetical protein